jgi:hypothetical protein
MSSTFIVLAPGDSRPRYCVGVSPDAWDLAVDFARGAADAQYDNACAERIAGRVRWLPSGRETAWLVVLTSEDHDDVPLVRVYPGGRVERIKMDEGASPKEARCR